jgi:hypothetical protein
LFKSYKKTTEKITYQRTAFESSSCLDKKFLPFQGTSVCQKTGLEMKAYRDAWQSVPVSMLAQKFK